MEASLTHDLDHWLSNPAIRVAHRRPSSASAQRLWECARSVRLSDTALLGRLVRWRIPGLDPGLSYHELFSHPPFLVLARDHRLLISGLVGRIWTLRRDYPELECPDEFRAWSQRGTARVMFANWVTHSDGDQVALHSETRVQAIGSQGRIGLAAVRPLVSSFHHLVESDGMELAIRRAEQR